MLVVGPGQLSISGEMDLAVERESGERLARAAERPSRQVDVCAVSFVDCAGPRILMSTRRKIAAAGGRPVLGGPSPSVWRPLDLTGLSAGVQVVDLV